MVMWPRATGIRALNSDTGSFRILFSFSFLFTSGQFYNLTFEAKSQACKLKTVKVSYIPPCFTFRQSLLSDFILCFTFRESLLSDFILCFTFRESLLSDFILCFTFCESLLLDFISCFTFGESLLSDFILCFTFRESLLSDFILCFTFHESLLSDFHLGKRLSRWNQILKNLPFVTFSQSSTWCSETRKTRHPNSHTGSTGITSSPTQISGHLILTVKRATILMISSKKWAVMHLVSRGTQVNKPK